MFGEGVVAGANKEGGGFFGMVVEDALMGENAFVAHNAELGTVLS